MGIREEISEHHDGILFADGFDKACIGVAHRHSADVACYDIDLCIEILMEDGMSYRDAGEYFEYNILNSFIGENTPVFIERFGQSGTLSVYGKDEYEKNN